MEILELEHSERRRWVEEIADINRKLAEMAQSL
jgi:triosephosphate isomerase